MRWIWALLVAALAAAGTLTDHFTSPPIEVLVIRTDQWLFCNDYGVTVQIKALDPVTVNGVKIVAKFFEEGTLMATVDSRSFSGFTLSKGESKQLTTSFNYCPQRRVDPLILLEIYVYLPNATWSYQYYIGRVLPTTYEDLAAYARRLEDKVKALEEEVARLKKIIDDLQARLRTREGQVANLTSFLALARSDINKLEAALSQVKAERDSLRAQLEQTQAQLNAVSQAKASLEAQLADLRRQYEDLKAAYEKLSGQYSDAQKTIAQLEARLADLQKSYQELQKAEQQLRDKYYSLSAEYNRLGGQYAELSRAYEQATAEKQMLQNRYSELNTGFTWAVNMATALGVALLFVIALFLTRKKYPQPAQPAPAQPPASVKALVIAQEERKETIVSWPATHE
ncbi:MAG: hypothetical protein ABWK05_01140 [Pyrobaculum sp.]